MDHVTTTSQCLYTNNIYLFGLFIIYLFYIYIYVVYLPYLSDSLVKTSLTY